LRPRLGIDARAGSTLRPDACCARHPLLVAEILLNKCIKHTVSDAIFKAFGILEQEIAAVKHMQARAEPCTLATFP